MLSIQAVAYLYKAELLCPNCTIEELKNHGKAELYDDSSEETMRILANRAGIDYSDQFSYDSDEFPKPVLQVELDDDRCDSCGREL